MKIMPCPFCGSDAIIVEVEEKPYPYRVQCLDSNCACRTDNFTKYEGAIRSWNKRVGEEDE